MVASEADPTVAGVVPVIGIPHVGDIKGYFLDTLLHLNRPRGTAVVRVENKPIDLARNLIVEAALADETMTHLFFMDSDMQFPRDALLRLVQRDLPVVGGIYFSRTETPIPHAYDYHHTDNPDRSCPLGWEHANGDAGTWYRPVVKTFAAYMKAHPEYGEEPDATVLPITDDSLVDVDALATGCLLIKREVLEAIRDAHPDERRPWFRCHRDTAGGEDFFFCERAKALGYRVVADFTVQATHEYRPVWMVRSDFHRRFKVGTPDEYDWDRDLVVDASPGRPAERAPEEPVAMSEAG